MNVIKIVVDESEELPENCFTCELSQKMQLDIYCPILNKKIFDLRFRPEACPLEVEEFCEWGTHTYDELADGDWKFCPNCGKRVKYVEE